jgi:hypothetical protein
MSKYNRPTEKAGVEGFIANEYNAPVTQPETYWQKRNREVAEFTYATGRTFAGQPATTRTHEGAPAWHRDNKSELFLLAVTGFMGGEDNFYESGAQRDDRFRRLVHANTLADPVWTYGFLAWLRRTAYIRTGALLGACQFIAAVSKNPELTTKLLAVNLSARKLVSAVTSRPDEPGEMLAIWHSNFAREEPKSLKRGLADAVLRLYNERNWLKWDSTASAWRFADVIDRVHPAAKVTWQHDLYTHILNMRHGRDSMIPESLRMLRANAGLRGHAAERPEYAVALLDADQVSAAGLTWEDVLSLGGQAKLDKAKLWESVIPSMGYMALLRNLRNFDEAGINPAAKAYVATTLQDPEKVRYSRQFPYRFYSAYKALASDYWRPALGEALTQATRNIPKLTGRSLILIDLSGSMQAAMSGHSKLARNEAAALFGVTLGLVNGADVRIFGTTSAPHEMLGSASVLREVERMMRRDGECGHGTHMAAAVAQGYRAHDRVFIISDMQSMDADISNQVPGSVPMYGFDLAGYRANPMELGPNRVQLGGLTDATFSMIPLIEAGNAAKWPWE